jgi:hypothetical protein
MESNAVTDLLRTGWDWGSDWASGRLFGSKPANEVQLQTEKNDQNKVNGSGPVNNTAAAQAPKSWTEYIFGQPTAFTSGKADVLGTGLPPVVLWVAIGALIWFVYRSWK